MRQKADYTCKFCKRPGSVCYDIELGTEHMFRIETWIAALACNRCADFRENIRNVVDRVRNVCAYLYAARQRGSDAAEHPAREKLTVIIGNLTRIVCDHYKMQRVEDPEFVEMVMEKPLHAANAIKVYMNGIARMSRQ